MRLKSVLILLLVTGLTVLPMSVIGQEEPLPVVTPRVIPLEAPTVILAVEPFHDPYQPTLLDAARANDYVTFDALVRAAKLRGESIGAFETLHSLWTYSFTDPIGAFYGAEMHDRLARAYPGYANFIEQYRIVDDHGSVFYPSSETRAFLLDRIVEGNAPRVQLAEAQPAPLAPVVVREAPEALVPSTTTAATTTTRRNRRTTSPAAATRVPASTPVDLPAPAAAETPAPVAAVTESQIADVPQPSTQTPPVEAPQAAATAPVVAEQQQPAPAAARTTESDTSNTTRGLLLLVIGLIGVGLLALMLRAPKETLPVTVMPAPQPQPAPQPMAKTDTPNPATPVVEPIRDPLRRPASPQGQGGSNRATGSRG